MLGKIYGEVLEGREGGFRAKGGGGDEGVVLLWDDG